MDREWKYATHADATVVSKIECDFDHCLLCIFRRSPSPEPIYSSDGKRLNTREFRTRKRLEEQRHQLVLRMQCMNPEFKPPADYKYVQATDPETSKKGLTL